MFVSARYGTNRGPHTSPRASTLRVGWKGGLWRDERSIDRARPFVQGGTRRVRLLRVKARIDPRVRLAAGERGETGLRVPGAKLLAARLPLEVAPLLLGLRQSG